MGKPMSRDQTHRRAAARRSDALARSELRYPSSERAPADGATSFAIKARDPETDAAIAAFLAKQGGR